MLNMLEKDAFDNNNVDNTGSKLPVKMSNYKLGVPSVSMQFQGAMKALP